MELLQSISIQFSPDLRGLRHWFSGLLLLMVSSWIQAQDPEIFFHSFAPEGQLNDVAVHKVLQDASGFLWIGTYSGLYRYDGLNLKHIIHDPRDPHSLLNNNILDMLEDFSGNIWLITESGLSCLISERNQFFNWFKLTGKLFLRKNGDVLLLNRQGRFVSVIQPQQNSEDSFRINPWIELEHFENAPPNLKITHLAEDHLERIWLGTNHGLWLYDEERGKVLEVQSGLDIEIMQTQGNALWIGYQGPTLEKMLLPDRVGESIKSLGSYPLIADPRIKLRDLVIDPEGNIWVASSKGIFLARPEPNKKNRLLISHIKADEGRMGALSFHSVSGFYLDPDNNLWVSTLQGLFQVRKQLFELNNIKLSSPGYVPLNQIIKTVHIDKESNLWVGTPNDGVLVRLHDQKDFLHLPLPGNACHDISETLDGRIMVSLDNSTWILKNGYGSSRLFDMTNWKLFYKGNYPIKMIQETSPGTVWMGSWHKGLIVASVESGQIFPSPLAREEKMNKEFHVEVVRKDRQGNMWVGTRGYGLFKLNPEGKVLYSSMLGAKKGEITYGVLDIMEDSRGRIWIGTRGGGLLCLTDLQQEYRVFEPKDGLPSNNVCGIAEDKFGRIWASTDNGLALYLPEEPIPFIHFGIEDGIINPRFNFHSVAKNREGRLFFGSQSGLYQLLPSAIPYNPENPHLSIRYLKVLQNEKDYLQQPLFQISFDSDQVTPIRLEHTQHSFEIQFSALDYAIPNKIKFAYFLEGYDTQWHYCFKGEQAARYLDIPAGQYKFRLMSSDHQGCWTRQTLELPLIVQPTFWQSPSGKVLLIFLFVILCLGILLLAIYWKQLRLRLHTMRTAKTKQDKSINYFSDLSHEIRNRMTLIMGPLERILRDNNQVVNLETVQKLYRNALQLKRLTDEIMNLRKGDLDGFHLRASKGDFLQVLTHLKDGMNDIADYRNIIYNLSTYQENLEGWFDRKILEIIVLNLIGNAFKYTPDGGTINISADHEYLNFESVKARTISPGKYFRCEIKNSGKGISTADIERIFDPFYQTKLTRELGAQGSGLGLNLVARLVHLHHGAIIADSQSNQLTKITFWLPKEKASYQKEELQLKTISHTPQNSSFSNANVRTSDRIRPLVLLADDDPELRQMLHQMLSDEFEVLIAPNGRQALELAIKHQPKLIISDLMMPEMGGLELLANIRENPLVYHTPFIMITAQSAEKQRLACIQHDANDFIEKPFRVEYLRWRIRNLLQNQELLRQKYSRVISVEPQELELPSKEDEFIQQVVELMEKHINSSWLSVEFLASEMNMSRATFYRRMEEIMQESPSQFIKQFRLKRAVDLLKQQVLNISEIAYATGFKSPRYFSKCFQKEFGLSPSAYLKSLANAK